MAISTQSTDLLRYFSEYSKFFLEIDIQELDVHVHTVNWTEDKKKMETKHILTKRWSCQKATSK